MSAVISAETVIAALGAAGVGGLISAAYGVRARRQEQMRDRMLSAADYFCGAAAAVFVALREVKPPWKPSHRNVDLINDPELANERRSTVEERLAHSRHLSGRVRLLFGPHSKAVYHVEKFLRDARHVARMSDEYWDVMDGDPDAALRRAQTGLKAIEQKRSAAWEHVNAFAEEAREATRRPDRSTRDRIPNDPDHVPEAY